MDIRVLKYFLTIAREESMTGAAKFLHVTQPTLSKQIKELEEELGKQLFIRTNYKVKLTDEGMLLRKRAEDILEMVEKTKTEFLTMDDITGGDVYIGGAETDAFKIFSQAASDLQTDYPNMCYHLFSGNSHDVMERLDRGLDDFGIVVDPVDLSKYDYLTLPNKDTWGVIMRKDSPLAAKESIQAADLLDVPIIMSRQASEQSLQKNEFAEWFGKYFEELNIVATFSLSFNPIIMAREGFGYVISFDNMINTMPENNLTFRPLEPKLESGLHIVWKKYQVFSPAAELFLNTIRAKFEA
ncbi:LysR family transcriptional regulator [Enterococcus sp. 669A]|uniref:LysR family transcriptional regulator n=1 Tax=Candidatus Enterococcus moelleringii TaxID=2815325 RepID=A0ABS3L9F1_9ENTE|nr:LysR family transcriptional regulator [Enterococcus sp. 669A]MBO1306249.1 LysR family transcriptional regulator [Enterococcus sp. 669A]